MYSFNVPAENDREVQTAFPTENDWNPQTALPADCLVKLPFPVKLYWLPDGVPTGFPVGFPTGFPSAGV